MQEIRNSIGMTSHPVALFWPSRVLQSMAKLAGEQFGACGCLNYTNHTIQVTMVYAKSENWFKYVQEWHGFAIFHKHTTTFCQALFFLIILQK